MNFYLTKPMGGQSNLRPFYSRATLFILVIVGSAVCVTAQEQTAKVTNPEKRQAVEAAADRVMQRYYETLDFGNIFKEMYVSDVNLRHTEIEAMTSGFLDWKSEDKISYAARERAYVAFGNFWFSMSAALLTRGKDLLPVLEKELKEPYESMTQKGKPTTSSELDQQFTAAMSRMSEMLRKHVARDVFGTSLYKTRVEKIEETIPADVKRIREVFTPAGLKPDVEIYVTQREIFHLYFIEEQGAFKLLTVLNRRQINS